MTVPYYRRNYHGDHFFFTLVTERRRPIFAAESARKLLAIAMRRTRLERPWETIGMVLLPDHLHVLWRLDGDDTDYSRRIGIIKRRFTRAFLAAGGSEAPLSQSRKGQRYRGVWQRKFWEHTIRNARDFHMHLDYIHMNPVKHGYVKRPRDWRWSSFTRYVRMGRYEEDWYGRIDLPETVEYFWPE
ncbi:MAG: REP-associated tyrosine transposase [Phycisphaerae bacterium]